jgi:hypothetical protein
LEPILGKRHSCDRESTFCLTLDPDIYDETTENQSTKRSSTSPKYTCVCKEGYFVPNQTLQGFTSDQLEHGGEGSFSCIRCPNECEFCDKDGVCNSNIGDEDESTESMLRAIIGSVLAICFACCIILAFIVYHKRKQRVKNFLKILHFNFIQFKLYKIMFVVVFNRQ